MPDNVEPWLECKEICADCPRATARTARLNCAHPWRHLIIDSIDPQTGEVPFSTPEKCHKLGARVSKHPLEDGSRPSLQLFGVEPARRHGYVVVRIANE